MALQNWSYPSPCMCDWPSFPCRGGAASREALRVYRHLPAEPASHRSGHQNETAFNGHQEGGPRELTLA